MTKTIYLNLEDDVAKIVTKLKRENGDEAVLVFPKKSFIFSDSINLRLLKKQIDMLGKKVSILTMDERGQNYAQEAGFELKRMPRTQRANSISDIRTRTAPVPESVAAMSQGFDPEPVEFPEPVESAPRKRAVAKKTTASKTTTARAAAAGKATAAKKTAVKKTTAKATAVKRPSITVSDEPIFDQGLEPVQKQENFFIPPDSKVTRPARRKSYRAYVVGFIALALVIILLLVLVVLPSASVVVYATPQSVSRDIDVIADVNAQTLDSAQLTIPAVNVNESQTIADTFQTNGKKEVGSKAEGRVAIYNLTGSPMALRASTTTLTIGNKSYVFKSDQGNVRPVASGTDNNATVADIVAVDGGEAFNVPAGTRVEITNQAFGSQPQRLYAKTVTQVVGGTSRFVSMVTKEDLNAAQSDLTKRVVNGINANLSGGNAKLVEGAYTVNVTSFNTDIPEGTEAQNFTAELKVNITGLAFDETALKNMIRQRLLMTLGANKDLQGVNNDQVIYQIKNLDANQGIMQLAIHYESKSKPRIDTKDLQNKLAGKSKKEASDLILSNSDIEKVEITVQPPWQSGLPRFGSKIHLEVRE